MWDSHATSKLMPFAFSLILTATADNDPFIDEAEQTMPELGETDELFLRFHCRAAFVVESSTPIDP